MRLPANPYAIGPSLHDWDYEQHSKEEPEIKNCPVCGSRPLVRYPLPEWTVDCCSDVWFFAEEETDMPLNASYTKMDAIEQWNEAVTLFLAARTTTQAA